MENPAKKKNLPVTNGDGLGCFNRLPEDITLLILNKVDFKSLCQNLTLSKSFASIAYRIETLTITLSTTGKRCSNIHLRDIICSNQEKIPAIIRESPMKILKFCGSLEKFRDLRIACVEFDSPKLDPYYSPPLMWKLMSKSSGSMVKNVISVLPQFIYKNDSDEESDKKRGLHGHHPHFVEWNAILFTLIKCHDLLESITIVDSKRSHADDDDRVFVLKDEHLIHWRNLLLFNDFCEGDTGKYYCQVISWGSMKLQKTEYVMKNVIFMVMSLREESNESERNDVMTLYCNDYEKELFGETVSGFISLGEIFRILEEMA